ncbi:MAG: DUF134 domain-containing protein [bacterium]|nr:DUF134 domain-containing protein [bacterium]
MPSGRPHNCRRVSSVPSINRYKPCGVPLNLKTEVVLSVDELEALKLADLQGLHHAKAGGMMGVSRATFGRIIELARRKTILALSNGYSLRIEGGAYEVIMKRNFVCADCGYRWESDQGRCHTPGCPKCGSKRFGCEHKPEPKSEANPDGCCGGKGEHHSEGDDCDCH